MLDGPGIDSQWPSGLRRGSAAAGLLRLCVRIPPGALMFVLFVLYSKDKRQKLGQSGQRSVDKAQRENKKKSRWWRDFLHPSRPALGSTSPPIEWISGLSSEGKEVGVWR